MDLIGKTLGQYQVVELLGRGGMASVYKAYQPALDRFVAVKVLPAQHALTPGFSERFVREARTVAQLNHPNILPVIDFGQEGELSYIVMKYVAGGTLKDRLGRRLDLAEAAHFVEQIAAALDHAHGRGVLHRDVKPSNVLLDEGDWVQLADFGLAKMMAGDAELTRSGASIGTPAYVSPEQGLGQAVDHRTDIYSLGVILYEMATGRLPFQSETPMVIVLKHMQEPPPPPRQINPAVPQAVEDVILRVMAKLPADRYSSAGEMARALQAAMTGQTDALPALLAPEPVAAPPTSAQVPWALERKHLSKLRQILDDRFDEEELRTLCFDMGVDYEDLPAKGQGGKARELVAYLERYDRIPELIQVGKQLRPDVPWEEVFPQPVPGPDGEELRELTPPPEPTRPPQVVDFVGRERELAYFVEKLATSGMAVITGMAGVGKTALAATLARRVTPLDQIFWHAFHEGEGVDALLWKLAGFLAWRGQEGVWRMLQGAQQGGGQPPPIEVLFDYLFQTLRGAGILVCLDDFQFVDDDPMLTQLVERLCKGVETGGLALIITSRRQPDFVGTTEFEALSGLSAADSQELLAARGLSLSAELVEGLYARTEGNAQFLTLAIDTLERARDAAHLIARLAETEDIERYLMSEVDDGLSGEEREVMGAVAVLLGYPGTRAAIETVLDGGGVRRALGDLGRRHLLTVGQGEWGREYGQHAMVGAFYYDLLGRRERREMHRRAGEFYEVEEPDALKAARHYERGGEYVRAAELATADVWALINQGQAQALRRLLARFKARQLGKEAWARVNLALGEVCGFLGERQAAQESYEESLKLLDALPVTETIRELKAKICRGLSDLVRYELPQEAMNWLEQGLAELEETRSEEKAALLLKKSTLQIHSGTYQTALETVQQALALLPEGINWLRLGAMLNLGMIYSNQGDLDTAVEVASEALAIGQQLNDHFRTAVIWNNLGIYKELAGDFEDAIKAYKKGLTLSEKLGAITYQVLLRLNIGVLYVKQGNDDVALQYLLDNLSLAQENRLFQHKIFIQSSLANLYLRQEKYQTADTTLAEAEKLAQRVGAKEALSEIYRIRALIQLGTNQVAAAVKQARQSVDLAHNLKMPLEEGSSLRVLTQALLANGQPEAALEAFEQSLALLEGKDPYEAARTQLEWGRHLLSGPDVEQGIALLRKARATFEKLGARRDLAEADEILGEIL